MNSSRNSMRRTGRQLAVGLLTAGVASIGLAAPAYAVGNEITLRPDFVNLANQGTVVFGGTADAAITAVEVSVDDDANDLTPPVVASVTLPAAGGEQNWQTPPMNLTPDPCAFSTQGNRGTASSGRYTSPTAPAVMASISKASQTGCGSFPMAGCPHRHMTRRATPGIIPIDSSSLSSGTA